MLTHLAPPDGSKQRRCRRRPVASSPPQWTQRGRRGCHRGGQPPCRAPVHCHRHAVRMMGTTGPWTHRCPHQRVHPAQTPRHTRQHCWRPQAGAASRRCRDGMRRGHPLQARAQCHPPSRQRALTMTTRQVPPGPQWRLPAARRVAGGTPGGQCAGAARQIAPNDAETWWCPQRRGCPPSDGRACAAPGHPRHWGAKPTRPSHGYRGEHFVRGRVVGAGSAADGRGSRWVARCTGPRWRPGPRARLA